MECLIGGAEEEDEGFTVGNKLIEVEELYLHSMPDMRSLCTVTTLPNGVLLRNLSELVIRDCHKLIDVLPNCMLLRTHQLMERLDIRRCDKLEKVLSLNFVKEEEGGRQSAAAGIVLLPRLKSLSLYDLPELRRVWDIDGAIMLAPRSLQNLQSLEVRRCKSLKDDNILPPILPIPNKLDHFPSLWKLDIWGCDSLTYLLSWRQAKGLPHLQRLSVENCGRMETVVVIKEEEEEEESHDVLPSLTGLWLKNLPMLRSCFLKGGEQCSSNSTISNSFKSLKDLWVKKCPKLKKLQPLSSSSSSLVDLQSLTGDSWEWFESLEWGDQDQSIKERLRPLFQPMQ